MVLNIFITSICTRKLISEFDWFRYRLNICMRSAIYDKVSRVSGMAFKYSDTGKISNLFSSDTYTIFVSINDFYRFASCPILVTFATVFTLNDFGVLGLLMPLLLVFNVAFVYYSSVF